MLEIWQCFLEKMVKYIIKTKEDTKNLAENIAKNCKKGDIILLNGDLGAGKTFFSSCFINYFAEKEKRPLENVVSPTFNLVKIYKTDSFYIYHFDLYRSKNAEELYELDLQNAFENVSLVEWPELMLPFLQNNCIEVNISIVDDCRIFDVKYNL